MINFIIGLMAGSVIILILMCCLFISKETTTEKEININIKYISAVNYAIKERERQLGRHLTAEEQQEIFTKIKKDFYSEEVDQESDKE